MVTSRTRSPSPRSSTWIMGRASQTAAASRPNRPIGPARSGQRPVQRRRPLLGERGDALRRCRRCAVVTVSSGCSSAQRVGRGLVPHRVERVAAQAHDPGRLGGQASPPARRPRRRARRRRTTRVTNPIRSASAASTRRPVIISSSAFFGRHRAGQRHGDHVRPQPDVDLGRAELRVVGRDDEVARQRQAHAAGQRVAADPGDRRLAQRPEVLEQLGEVAPRVVQVEVAGAVGHARQVGAGAERPVSRAGEHEHPGRRDRPGTRRPGGAARRTTDHDSALRRSGRLMVRRAMPASTE